MGTPHRGAELALRFNRFLSLEGYMKELCPLDETLMDINNSFRELSRPMHYASFYESEPYKQAGVLFYSPQNLIL